MPEYMGFDTSNYRTSVALFRSDTDSYSAESRLLDVEAGQLGLRQRDAVFAHITQLPNVAAALSGTKALAAVGASTRPRAAEGSYMPCFLVGECVARCIASALSVPFYAFSHQQGHIAAAAFASGHIDLLDKPFLAWHLSGGTTELLLVTPDKTDIIREEIIGGTTDISAGQLIDRAGVMLGMRFPAGAQLADLAESCEKNDCFRVKTGEMRFSLSGVENKVRAMFDGGEKPENIASYTINTVLYAIINATEQAIRKFPGYGLLCSGGVMSNTLIKNSMKERFDAYFAPPQLSSDNALGIALLCSLRDKNNGRA